MQAGRTPSATGIIGRALCRLSRRREQSLEFGDGSLQAGVAFFKLLEPVKENTIF